MKIIILSQYPDSHSTHRLIAAAEEAGHEARVLNYLKCWINIAAHRPQVIYEGEPVTDVDAVIPRIGASSSFYGNAVLLFSGAFFSTLSHFNGAPSAD